MAATVIVQQPQMKTQMNAWSTSLFDCCHDMNTCCYAYWCCPCFACSTTGEFGESTCLPLVDLFGPGFMAFFGMVVCVPPVTLGMRVAVRHRYDIGGSICEDILVSCCCILCSWCQMNREIKERKKLITIVSMQPLVQNVPITTTTTQVVSMEQQSVGMIGTTQVANAPPPLPMSPIPTNPPVIMKTQ